MKWFDIFRKSRTDSIATEAKEQSTKQECLDIAYIDPLVSTQKEVMEYLLKDPQGITFIHGKAGTGKTHLIRQLTSQIPGCQVLTPTNLAANLYNYGQTVHKFFYGYLDDLVEGYQNPDKVTESRVIGIKRILERIKMIVIDEVSMVRADLFEMINEICCVALNNECPFGGIPTVIVGDLFQLPPIVTTEAEYKYLENRYGGIYFFHSDVIKKNLTNIKLFELEKSYRQSNDDDYVRLLDNFRRPLSNEEKINLITALNKRVVSETEIPGDAIYIASSNDQVNKVNSNKLAKLHGDSKTIYAKIYIKFKDKDDHLCLNFNQLPTEENVEQISLPTAFDGELKFKVGAKIMFTRNVKHLYHNGEFGIIKDFHEKNGFKESYFEVKNLNTGEIVNCPPVGYRYRSAHLSDYRYEMEYNSDKQELERKLPYVQRTVQYPIKLAYAFTIHKSQGQTYDEIVLDLSSHIFAPGQLYVALSRVRSLSGLYLTKPISYSDIISDEEVFHFIYNLRINNRAEVSPIITRKEKNQISPNCRSFIYYIDKNESDDNLANFLRHILTCYSDLCLSKQPILAANELQKVVDVICEQYDTSLYDDIIDKNSQSVTSIEECNVLLNTIFEIYTSVVKTPKKQVSFDNNFSHIKFKI